MSSCLVIRIYPPCTAIVCRLDGRLQRTKLRSSLDIKPNCSGLAPGLARPKINASSNETLPAVWSVVSRQLATLLHSDIQIQSYGPGTKLLLWAIRDSFFTLNSTYLMHGLRNHWVSFPYYCVHMNSWHWTSTGWPFKVREDASHIWQTTVDHGLVATGLDMSSRWRAGAGSGCVNNVSMVCSVHHRRGLQERETAIYYSLSSWELGDPRGASTVTFSSEDEVAVYGVLLPSSELSLCLLSARPRPHRAPSTPLPRPWPTPGTRREP